MRMMLNLDKIICFKIKIISHITNWNGLSFKICVICDSFREKWPQTLLFHAVVMLKETHRHFFFFYMALLKRDVIM